MKKPNAAQRIHALLGMAVVEGEKDAPSYRNTNTRKSGPGRRHDAGEPGHRLTKGRKVRAYEALCAAWAAKRVTKAKLRDQHGAYTLVGRNAMPNGVTDGRRVWLGGISAQRGY